MALTPALPFTDDSHLGFVWAGHPSPMTLISVLPYFDKSIFSRVCLRWGISFQWPRFSRRNKSVVGIGRNSGTSLPPLAGWCDETSFGPTNSIRPHMQKWGFRIPWIELYWTEHPRPEDLGWICFNQNFQIVVPKFWILIKPSWSIFATSTGDHHWLRSSAKRMKASKTWSTRSRSACRHRTAKISLKWAYLKMWKPHPSHG